MPVDRGRVVREELWRSVVWFGGALFAWSVVLTSTDALATNAATFVGPVAAIWGLMTLVMVGVRFATGYELKRGAEGEALLWVVTGCGVVGLAVLYVVLSGW
jgi:hypothetical protein